MKFEHAQGIVEYAHNLGVEAEVRKNYSGRGMYGRETAGVVIGNIGDFVQAVAGVSSELTSNHTEDEVDDFINDMGGLTTDNMGRDIIIY